MAQWIQYLLDTCQSVAEVLATIGQIALDGWEWHFFVADQTGRYTALDQLERGSTQWSQVIDMSVGRIYFRTAQARQIKYLDTTQLDFSPAAPVQVVDINQDGAGDVTTAFTEYSAERNRQLIKDIIETADGDGGFTQLVEMHDETLSRLIRRIADYPIMIGVL